MGFEFKMNGDWFPETPETFAELQALAKEEPEIWEAMCDPLQNDWTNMLGQLHDNGAAAYAEALTMSFPKSPGTCWRIALKLLVASEAELPTVRKEVEEALSAEERRVLMAEQRELEESLRNGTCLKTGICRTIALPGDAEMKMIYCPPGEFMMGSPESEEGRCDAEVLHHVELTKGFWLGKYPVTQRQWLSVMGKYFVGDAHLPNDVISWDHCKEFVEKVKSFAKQQLGGEARFPTEAEWEYACRAGTTTAYFWGNALNGDKANCDGNYPCGTAKKGQYLGKTTPVGRYGANAWGFADMHGNVYEWCADWYGDYSGDVVDPTGPASGDYRVLRGGSWSSHAERCRSAHRGYSEPRWPIISCGFRLCCSAGDANFDVNG